MKKKILCYISCIILLGSFSPMAISNAINYQSGENSNFLFADVHKEDWYYDSVYTCYEAGIFEGDHANHFYPTKELTIMECYAILTRLHQIYINDTAPIVLSSAENWSAPYQDYCMRHQITFQEESETYAILNRELFAKLLARTVSLSKFDKINEIDSIVDYDVNTNLGNSILLFYQTGIICGTSADGKFSPLSKLTRAECATIIARIISPNNRFKIAQNYPLFEMELPFLTSNELGQVYNFDGKYIYQMNSNDGGETIYSVTDLYGRVVRRSSNLIEPQQNGIFKQDDHDIGQSIYYDTYENLICTTPMVLTYSFSYGILGYNQDDGTIRVIDTRGREINTIKNEEEYFVVGSAFGEYLPVVPIQNRNYKHSYWMDIYEGTVKEIPYRFVSAFSAPGYDYKVVDCYDENRGHYLYNAIDKSINLVFPQEMDNVQMFENGILLAQDDGFYYIIKSGKDIEKYPKVNYGEIEKISLSGYTLHAITSEEIRLSNIQTGEVIAGFSGNNTYMLMGHKLIRLNNNGGEFETVDILNEAAEVECSEIPIDNIWYGDNGELLYRVSDKYYYIAG